jgi:peptidoglycan/LPS O-acetylase OafA/YrhL
VLQPVGVKALSFKTITNMNDAIASGHDNGFNTIRLLAAAAVLVSHSFVLTTGLPGSEPLYALTGGRASVADTAVGTFFVLSGLLIAASADRSTTQRSFWTKRAMRIGPALWVSVLLTWLVMGPLWTSIDIARYFASDTSFSYLANLVFLPNPYALAGVFEGNPLPGVVNGSLWTLRYEIICYAICAVVMAMPRFRTALVLAGWLASFVLYYVGPHLPLWEPAAYHLTALAKLFRFFGAGMLVYLLRDRVPLNRSAAWACALCAVVATVTPFFTEAWAIFGSYLIIYFGYNAPRAFRDLTGRGDISYGTYIYAFPVQQIMVPFCMTTPLPWLTNIALSLPVTFGLAIMSWILIERPAINLGHRLSRRPGVAAA